LIATGAAVVYTPPSATATNGADLNVNSLLLVPREETTYNGYSG
jgi:hypothetical protein